ncbi:uncharacterized protein EV154DRAFT_500730 [Mucor mucedo]|uniref:uncharacterized protein n=1 Tax=Mucor mucedo TaxID=29922 RepID=UPI00221E42C1|nr:uncharacterized protein EV154DRAFT_500730 [Mucor mucedo]KAI7893765.1 hypothetical protein EV154DRAFT_500730 [Mucor mucedo]
MFKEFKNKFKSNSEEVDQLPSSASTPVLSTPTNFIRKRTNSVLSKLASRSSVQSMDIGTNSSSSSNSMPSTPRHGRSNASLPYHDHLKPGNNAELLSYDKTMAMYLDNAKRTNDPRIQCDLAVYLFESSKPLSPKQKKPYVSEATKILKTLALRGHAESQYYLANMFASKPDFGNAFPLFVQAAKHQHADAAYRAAKCYEDGLGCLKNKSKAVQYYKLAATLNHPGAMYRLGLADINGDLGLQRNIRDGNKWLKRSAVAATPEYPHALHELGLLHEKGLSDIIFKDVSYSIQLYRQAADLGYAPSAYRLGESFEYGYLGCKIDATNSIYYYTIAARQGDGEACFALSAWYLVGDDKKIKPNEEKALYYATVAAEKGSLQAAFALGYFAEVGIAQAQNLVLAKEWYQKAANGGNEQAKKKLISI